MNASLQVLGLLAAVLVCPSLSSQKRHLPRAHYLARSRRRLRGFRDRSFGDPKSGGNFCETVKETVKVQLRFSVCTRTDNGGRVVVTRRTSRQNDMESVHPEMDRCKRER
jgi:hypothetical protein